MLAQYAKDIELEPRARFIPEEAIEALLGRQDAEDGLARLHSDSGIAEERALHLITLPRRSHKLVDALRELYGGRCQVCAWDPPVVYGAGLCEAHQVRWLSRGGSDELSNLALLCPNHHRAVHSCDAQFDWKDRLSCSEGFVSRRGWWSTSCGPSHWMGVTSQVGTQNRPDCWSEHHRPCVLLSPPLERQSTNRRASFLLGCLRHSKGPQ